MLGIFVGFFCFSKFILFKKFILKKSGITPVSISLDPDQDKCFVRPDRDSNCLQRLSVDSTSRQRDNAAKKPSKKEK